MSGVLFLLILGGAIFLFMNVQIGSNRKKQANVDEAKFLVSLLAKVAKSDGRVSELEARLITQVLDDLSQKVSGVSGVREYLKEVYNSQKENVDNAYETARNYKRAFNLNYDTCVARLTFFLNLAYIDGEFNKSEQDVIRNIAYGFGIDKETLDEIIYKFDSFYGSRFGADHDEISQENDAFEVLGLSKNASLDEVKARYKELVRQYHPDILMGRGESKDVIERSTKKLQEINQAYGRLKEKFGVYMKKFISLLLAVAGFCNDFKVVNVDGKEIKFKLTQSELYRDQRLLISNYDVKDSNVSIVFVDKDGNKSDIMSVQAKKLNEISEYIFSYDRGIKVMKFSSKKPICEALEKEEPVNLSVLDASYFDGNQISSYAFSVDIVGQKRENFVDRKDYYIDAAANVMITLETLSIKNIAKDIKMGQLLLVKGMCLTKR